MMVPVIGKYTLNDKIHFRDKNNILLEGIIVLIGLNAYVVASQGCVYIVNDCDIEDKYGSLRPGEPLPSVDKAFGDGIAEYIANRQSRIDYLEGMIYSLYENVCKNIKSRILYKNKNDMCSLFYNEILEKIKETQYDNTGTEREEAGS